MKHRNVKVFDELATHFLKHGYKLYMVGGTSRDFLLGKSIKDFDFATDATPDDMETFLSDANYRFRKFGTVSLKYLGERVEITTLRIEGKYSDFRHPSSITFVKTPAEDYIRRDFTINALYIDANYDILDYNNGLKDLKARILRMIGNPHERFLEDPLRIIRALRFIAKFNLTVDEELENAIKTSFSLLLKLNPEKVTSELRKVDEEDRTIFNSLYNTYKA